MSGSAACNSSANCNSSGALKSSSRSAAGTRRIRGWTRGARVVALGHRRLRSERRQPERLLAQHVVDDREAVLSAAALLLLFEPAGEEVSSHALAIEARRQRTLVRRQPSRSLQMDRAVERAAHQRRLRADRRSDSGLEAVARAPLGQRLHDLPILVRDRHPWPSWQPAKLD
eukprot:4170164-Prymnesium_polylepis.3